jgi:hypothetical protein
MKRLLLSLMLFLSLFPAYVEAKYPNPNGDNVTLIGTEAHESTHMWQQNKMGWANFYGKTIKSYFSEFFKYGTINNLYNTHGTLEWQADHAAEYYKNNIY